MIPQPALPARRDILKITDFANFTTALLLIPFALLAHPPNAYPASKASTWTVETPAAKDPAYSAFKPQAPTTRPAKPAITDARLTLLFKWTQPEISCQFVFLTAHQRQNNLSFWNTQVILVLELAAKPHRQASHTPPLRLTTRFTIISTLASMGLSLRMCSPLLLSIIMAPMLRPSVLRWIWPMNLLRFQTLMRVALVAGTVKRS